MTLSAVLRLDGVSHGFGDRLVLDNLSFVQEQGQHQLLLGPSGSGKTTLINLAAGLLTPQQGSIQVCGHEIGGLSQAGRDEVRRRHVGIIFQTLRLVGPIDVTANLLLAQRLAGRTPDQSAVAAVLDRLGIAHRAHAKPRELSQGEAQRAAIARALVAKPALLIADEPTSALDDANAANIARLLLEEAEANGSTLLIATHDVRLRRYIADTVDLQPQREAA